MNNHLSIQTDVFFSLALHLLEMVSSRHFFASHQHHVLHRFFGISANILVARKVSDNLQICKQNLHFSNKLCLD